eukprot:SAG31_NODE_43612_length_266_cov_0.898204_1_plen_29_part_10
MLFGILCGGLVFVQTMHWENTAVVQLLTS